jgi:hypothetical protein
MAMVGSLTERARRRGHHGGVRGCIVVALLTLGPAAHADDAQQQLSLRSDAPQLRLDARWPGVPAWHGLSEDAKLVERLTAIGNRVGDHIDELSHDWIGLHVDGRGQRARLRFGGGDTHYLAFHVDSDWHFVDGKARVQARLQLALAGHVVDVHLPDFDVSTDSYHGTQMVDVNVPLLERRF